MAPAWSTSPVVSVCNRQPPSVSASISCPTASDVMRGLETDMVAPLRITTKSDMQMFHSDRP